MAKKGKAKNTLNKAKHTKLMNRKINKVKLEKQLNKERLKAIIKKVNEDKEHEETENEY
jgi:5,10-methylene-tetrahydrofolate dehydrogenase/methenyl tetrahydrofolate cyclohydrolase